MSLEPGEMQGTKAVRLDFRCLVAKLGTNAASPAVA